MKSDGITKGTIAVCGIGCIGLITEEYPKDVVYSDGTPGIAYVGIHLTDKVSSIGSVWSSRHPRVIGHIDDFINTLKT